MGRFRTHLDSLKETDTGDIASVDSRLGDTNGKPIRRKNLEKGKKCKKHKRLNCEICDPDNW